MQPPKYTKTTHSYPGWFITFAGIDGAGKTTMARMLGAGLRKQAHRVVQIDYRWPNFAESYVQQQCERLRAAIWDPNQPQYLLGHRHFHFLVGAWFEMIDRCIVRPALKDGAVVVVDSWYHKQAAHVAAWRHTITPSEARALSDSLTEPDVTILLDVPPNVAALRKRHLSVNETGLNDGLGEGGVAGFELFQSSIRKELLAIVQQSPKAVVIPAADFSPDELAHEVLGCIPTAWRSDVP